MTADEMFRALGYEKTKEKPYVVFKKNHNEISVFEDGYTAKVHRRTTLVGLARAEVKAVAKLLEEMEEHEQASIIE